MSAERAATPAPERPPSGTSYEAAAARVEEIIRRLDSGEASLDETLALVSEGKALIELCAAELARSATRSRSCGSTSWSRRLEREAER